MSYANHSRSFKDNKYVYPVLSRRAKGISVGINLNPDKVCNFNCVYCQVDRKPGANVIPTKVGIQNDGLILDSCFRRNDKRLGSFSNEINLSLLSTELEETLDLIKTGRLFSIPPFDKIPSELRHLSDIAISGDGEPTTVSLFYEVIEEIVRVKTACFNDIKIILITNASGLNRPRVQDALDLIYKNNGETWAKLDAGSESYYKKVCRSNVSLQYIVCNIISAAQKYPIVIQSCFNKIGKIHPPMDEIERYALLLKEMAESGGMIRLVQIYTVARPPAEHYVAPLSEAELAFIASKVQEIANLPSEIYT
jgi:wyosine [tRNA(Phe)-imidazoG37] synthetase (radical SAM superfamily)